MDSIDTIQGIAVLIGFACLLAAAVGGGVKLAGNEIPLLESWRRQLLVAVVGVVALALAFIPNTSSSSPPDPGPTPTPSGARSGTPVPPPGTPPPDEGRVWITPESGRLGVTIETSGDGFRAGEPIVLGISGPNNYCFAPSLFKVVKSVRADTNGKFGPVSLELPDQIKGTYTGLFYICGYGTGSLRHGEAPYVVP
jgi:hypothetical protein